MFNFDYHIPSAMNENSWAFLQHDSPSPASAAIRAISRHYRGSESPATIEIWIRVRKKGRSQKIRKFLGEENGKNCYDLKALPDKVLETI